MRDSARICRIYERFWRDSEGFFEILRIFRDSSRILEGFLAIVERIEEEEGEEEEEGKIIDLN